MSIEWHAFGGQKNAHLINTTAKYPKRSGVRALCGAYPGKSYSAWFQTPVGAEGDEALRVWSLKKCPNCLEKGVV